MRNLEAYERYGDTPQWAAAAHAAGVGPGTDAAADVVDAHLATIEQWYPATRSDRHFRSSVGVTIVHRKLAANVQ